SIRPEIMQYFVETDTEGRPLNRIFRSLIYQRAKKVNATTPFGTQMDVYQAGYEWMSHSVYCLPHHDINHNPRILIGGPKCKKPYSASVLNISAMSYGSLSKNAILALNEGASKGGFYHNTGEGAISPYHLEPGGDLVWQIGTGYFGCRNKKGQFDIDKFREKAQIDNVKMIEIKISQGAKPGHGGILPAVKNTAEIAAIRGIEPHTTVFSPPGHTAFKTAHELMEFISKLREASGGKPIGFKLCVGRREEFTTFCEAMVETGLKPDFITVDGGEGGTGAAPVEFSNSLGMPLRDGLSFVHDTLIGYNLRKDIKLIAAGKILSGFHMVRAMALGADICNSARAMMLSVGCIQALQCNQNTCPTGVATQNRMLMRGLNPKDKSERVANFHQETLISFTELLGAAGISHPKQIERRHIHRRVSMNQELTYADLYPPMKTGSLLKKETTH
ncbi:MAG: FMN-binding glutamate synthase family protein, partial [Cyclobacteriaceae bacterium]|nr:FMN-binding glutamate synthase family protein [Cyclobacteriaceae bacterium HetDA_MAG_MS6]